MDQRIPAVLQRGQGSLTLNLWPVSGGGRQAGSLQIPLQNSSFLPFSLSFPSQSYFLNSPSLLFISFTLHRFFLFSFLPSSFSNVFAFHVPVGNVSALLQMTTRGRATPRGPSSAALSTLNPPGFLRLLAIQFNQFSVS